MPPAHRSCAACSAGTSRWFAKASYGRMRLEGAIAPTFVAGPLTRRLQREDEGALLEVLGWAAARGVPVDGALPIYVGPGLRNPWYGPDSEHRSGGAVDGGVIMRSTQWRLNEIVVHEFGHALGMLHANVQACRRGAHVCRHGNHRATAEYGDPFDIMGHGSEWFGAYNLAALGLAPIVSAPPGQAVSAIRPQGSGEPDAAPAARCGSGLVHRVAHQLAGQLPAPALPARAQRGRLVREGQVRDPEQHVPAEPDPLPAFDRPRVHRDLRGAVPLPARPPAHGPRRLHHASVARAAGASEDAVAGPHAAGADRHELSSLCRCSVPGRSCGRPVRADARGAGLLAVEVNQNGAITRVAADSIPGLVRGRRGRGTVRVPLAAGAVSAAMRLIDAAGNASPWTPLDLSRRVKAARVAFGAGAGPRLPLGSAPVRRAHGHGPRPHRSRLRRPCGRLRRDGRRPCGR